jgi:hypothetical protein
VFGHPIEQKGKNFGINGIPLYLGMIIVIGATNTGIIYPYLITKEFHPKKISGRLCFDRTELDKVLADGDHKRGRGRPKKG